jgi:hypothetical protein
MQETVRLSLSGEYDLADEERLETRLRVVADACNSFGSRMRFKMEKP